MIEAVVLLSTNRHPLSGRPRRSGLSARAVEVALRAWPSEALRGLHVGDPADPGLRDFAGMGLQSIAVVQTVGQADPVPALAELLAEWRPGLVLCGAHQAGDGMTPYRLARQLGIALISEAAEVHPQPDGARVVRVLPNGARHTLETRAPSVLVVGAAGPAPRLPALARAARFRPEVIAMPVAPVPTAGLDWTLAGRRTARQALRAPSTAGLSAFLPGAASTERTLSGASTDAAADRLLEWLCRRGVEAAARAGEGDGACRD